MKRTPRTMTRLTLSSLGPRRVSRILCRPMCTTGGVEMGGLWEERSSFVSGLILLQIFTSMRFCGTPERSSWVQMSEGNGEVRGVVKTKNGYSHAAAVVAQSGCWSMMKGGFSSNTSGPAHLYFESNNTRAKIWADVSLQPFTHHQWRSHREESTQKVRKRTIHFHAVDARGNNLAGANISVSLVTARFPFGCAMNKNIMTNAAYQNWFTSRFFVTTFEDEMKWYSTEATQGREDYSVPDAMLAFAKKHGISVRGHNVLWDDSRFQPGWVYSLSPDQLRSAATKRVQSVVSRYAGQLIGWDVVNENLHFNFFESKLGGGTSEGIYQQAHKLDPRTTMFLNDYYMEEKHDNAVTPAKYLDMVRKIQAQGATGIGLEGHFNKADVAYVILLKHLSFRSWDKKLWAFKLYRIWN